MGNAMFWWAVMVALIVFSWTGAKRIRPSGLGDVVFSLCHIGALVCLGAGFVALLDRSTTPSIYYGGPTDWVPLKIIGGIVVVGACVWIPMWWLGRASRAASLNKNDFNTASLSLSIDRAAGIVRLAHPGSAVVEKLPLGRVQVQADSFNDITGQAVARLTIREWPKAEENHLFPVAALSARARTVHEAHVPAWTAKALMRWLDAHPELSPDLQRMEGEWTSACDGLLRYCRQQRDTGTATVIEKMVFSDGPALTYLCIEADGRWLVGTGPHPELMVMSGPLAVAGRTVVLDVPERHVFELDDGEVRALQSLQARGVLAVVLPKAA